MWFWFFRGYVAEGRRWVERALAWAAQHGHAELVSPVHRATLLHAAAGLAWAEGEHAASRIWLLESTARFRQIGDRRRLAHALVQFALAYLGERDAGAARVPLGRHADQPLE